MASCEKCWRDAGERMTGDKSAEYQRLIIERKGNPCTPEEQAGDDASICSGCKRKTVHQYVHICMNPDCKMYYKKAKELE